MTISKRISLPILLLLLCELVLLLFFPPSLIFDSSTIAGGDTPSHIISAFAMRDKLLSPFSPATWIHGNYGGFPLFLHYFPFSFFLMALASLAIPMQVAFKLVTLLAILPLPPAIYFALRRLGCSGSVPALGALLSMPFLFMTENSMWGGNMFSTLAGEFSFGISFILSIILMSRLYTDVPVGKSLFTNSLIEAGIALCSGYPLLYIGMGTSYFVLRGRILRYVLCLHAAAFGLAAFWLLPLLWRVPWNTPYSHAWNFERWQEIAPPVIWPSIVGAVTCLIANIGSVCRSGFSLSALRSSSGNSPELYLWWQFLIALFGFSIAPLLGLVDIRFLPFAQISLAMLGAIGWGKIISGFSRSNLWTLCFAVVVICLAMTKAVAVESWIRWNYSGMESKPLWNAYSQVNSYLKGTSDSPRVVYEHVDITNGAGTVRAFELLPYFSGRSTLEGLYMQSSPSSPFVFYIQSEFSLIPSCPFPRYHYSRPDPERAARHLRLFNVNQVIAASENISAAMDMSSEYELETIFPPYRIYRLKDAPNSYVEPLRFKPFRISFSRWKDVQFEWFRKSTLRVPLVVASPDSPGNYAAALPNYDGSPENIPEVPISDPKGPQIHAEVTLGDNRISITTSRPGHPLWVKISYHPDWKITEGSGELYPASPAFMLLVPNTPKVVLTFDTHGGIYFWGKILGIITLGIFAFTAYRARRGRRRPARQSDTSESGPSNVVLLISFGFVLIFFCVSLATRIHSDPNLLYNAANARFQRATAFLKAQGEAAPGAQSTPDLQKAHRLLDECLSNFGRSAIADHCMDCKAQLLMNEKRWDELRATLEEYLRSNPDTRFLAEVLAFQGEACFNQGQTAEAEKYFLRAVQVWPFSDATRHAGLRLAEIAGPENLLRQAKDLIQSGKLTTAYTLLWALNFSSNPDIRGQAALSLAYCCCYMNRWQEASNLFLQWLSTHFDDPESIEAQAALRKCRYMTAQENSRLPASELPDPTSALPGWFMRLFQWTK